MRVREKKILVLSGVLAITAALVLLTTVAGAASSSGAQRVSWDIVSLKFTPLTLDPGGYAEAQTPAPAETFGPTETIRLTGHGTFKAPSSSGGKSFAVTGGGTWTIFNSAGAVTASGTYKVTQLVQWDFAGFQSATPVFIDNTGDVNERANGTAVLRIEFSSGDVGVLTVGCHGPGAPNHIFEGIATTKGFKTYYEVQDPAPGVDANRTIFHVD